MRGLPRMHKPVPGKPGTYAPPRTPLRPAPLVHAGQACATDDGRRQRHGRVVRLDPGARRRGSPYRRPCCDLARPGVRQAARQCRGFAAAFHGETSMAGGYPGVGTPVRPAPPVLAAQASATGGTPSEIMPEGCGWIRARGGAAGRTGALVSAWRGRAFGRPRGSAAQAACLTPSGGGCGAASAGVRGRRGCRSGWWTGNCGPAASAGRAGRRRG